MSSAGGFFNTGGMLVLDKMAEIEGYADKIEDLIKTLLQERDEARTEVIRLKKLLDDRELELLQLDEEFSREKARYDQENTSMRERLEEAGGRLNNLATRLREIMPLLPDDPDA